MVGSLGNLYQSVQDLNQSYMQPNQTKDPLLNPKAQSSTTQIAGLLTQNYDDDVAIKETRFFTCSRYGMSSSCGNDVSYDYTTLCSGCSQPMTREMRFVGKMVALEKTNSIKSGFVKDIVTFMVMDDLVIQPMSTISSITLLNKFNVKEIDTLQEKVVELGMDEGIKLLKASLQSKMVLTSVFIKKQY